MKKKHVEVGGRTKLPEKTSQIFHLKLYLNSSHNAIPVATLCSLIEKMIKTPYFFFISK